MSVEDLEWVFERGRDDEVETAGIATAAPFPVSLDTLVRESVQNCRDARPGAKPTGAATIVFHLEELCGDSRENFLSGIRWEVLRKHIEASRKREYKTIYSKLTRGLKALDESDRIRLLHIADYQTEGLTGGEFDSKTNYGALLRAVMLSSKSGQTSGGTYGLGKSNYWTFSELNTVLFHSYPHDSLEPLLVGRCELGTHEVDGRKFEGKGTFGIMDPAGLDSDPQMFRAAALRGDSAPAAAEALSLQRDPAAGDSGTTITIVGFAVPPVGMTDESAVNPHDMEVEQLCRLLNEAVQRHYWPALIDGSIDVEVRGSVNGKSVAELRPACFADDMPPAVRPFARAYVNGKNDVTVEELSPGAATSISLPMTVPEKLDGTSKVNATVTLKARRALPAEVLDPEESKLQGLVARIRGTGMVVDYAELRGVDFEGHAVLLVGEAKAEPSEGDAAVEQFLKACEKAAHNEWTAEADEARDAYVSKGQPTVNSALNNMMNSVAEALTAHEPEIEIHGDDVSEDLRRRFRVGGRDLKTDTKKFRLNANNVRPGAPDGRYEMSVSLVRSESTKPPKGDYWHAEVVLEVAEEGGGTNDRIPIARIVPATPGVTASAAPNGSFQLRIPRTVGEVNFEVVSEENPQVGLPLDQIMPVVVVEPEDYESS